MTHLTFSMLNRLAHVLKDAGFDRLQRKTFLVGLLFGSRNFMVYKRRAK